MINKLGIVTTTIHCPVRYIRARIGGYLCDLPEDRQDVPDGYIAYLDRTGMLQFMEAEK